MNRTFVLVVLFSLCCCHSVCAANHGGQFEGDAAYTYLVQLCDLGSRMSGSPGMERQQALLREHFEGLGLKVTMQPFAGKRHPRTGRPVAMANMIVELHPEATERILLCAHYDTRPLPDLDPNKKLRTNGVFLGANDGASGTALWMEMAKHLRHQGKLGVDIVYFDAEEFVWNEYDKYFLGSEHFAKEYRDHPPKHRYEFGVLVDMVGDAKLNLLQEPHSVSWEGTRPLVKEIWATAKRLGVREFRSQVMRIPVRDDHLPLNQIARIPVCNVIDFQYPNFRNSYWHTTADAPENCSAESLGKVGWVLEEWIKGKR